MTFDTNTPCFLSTGVNSACAVTTQSQAKTSYREQKNNTVTAESLPSSHNTITHSTITHTQQITGKKRKVQKVYPLQGRYSDEESSSGSDSSGYSSPGKSESGSFRKSVSPESPSTSPEPPIPIPSTESAQFEHTNNAEPDQYFLDARRPPAESSYESPSNKRDYEKMEPSGGSDISELLVVDSEDDSGRTNSENSGEKQKKKKRRVLFSKQQTRELERRFCMSFYISPQERDALARELKMDPDQVKIWFQNHRYKLKKYHKENVDHPYQPVAPLVRGLPYPSVIRKPDSYKEGVFAEMNREHAIREYVREARLLDQTKALDTAMFAATAAATKPMVRPNRMIPTYPTLHPRYPYEITPYPNYYINPAIPRALTNLPSAIASRYMPPPQLFSGSVPLMY